MFRIIELPSQYEIKMTSDTFEGVSDRDIENNERDLHSGTSSEHITSLKAIQL